MRKLIQVSLFALLVLFVASCDDEDVNLPPVISGQVFSLTENMTNGTVLGTITASDPESGALTFAIAGGNTGTAFALDGNTGELSISDMTAIDFETAISFNLNVEVSDGTLSTNALVVVNITDDANDNAVSFKITLTNVINYLSSKAFNTPAGAITPGPLTVDGAYYSVDFYATPGTRLSFATMSAATNDWFFAPDGNGIALFTGNNAPVTGDITGQVMLWDGGTEEEDPATVATMPNGGTAGAADDNNRVRLQTSDISAYAKFQLSHDGEKFTLTIMRVSEMIITPGMLVVHAQDNPLFTEGQPDRGVGLEEIAEAGNPMVLYNWFNEAGTDGAPLRMSSSITPFAPGLAYVFPGSESDPLFTQGSPMTAGSGLEKMAEDGGADEAITYLTDNGYMATAADQMAPVFPGEEMTFTIWAKPGYKFGFATMFINSNDWFFSFNNNGVELFDADGTPKSGTGYSPESYLFDAGTEVDEPVGTGMNQAPRQAGPNTGAADADTNVRRVGEIEDVQFGKGVITSGPGVVYLMDPRGGYNLIKVTIEPLN